MKKTQLALPLALLTAQASFGQTWTGATNSDWGTGTNWSGGSAPPAVGTGQVIINNIATNTPSLTTSFDTNPNGAGGDMWIGNGSGTGALNVDSGGILNSSGNWLFIQNGGILNVNNGGTVTSVDDIRLDSGQINVASGGIVTVPRIVGDQTVTVSGSGQVTTSSTSNTNGSHTLGNVIANNLGTGGSIAGAGVVTTKENSTSVVNGGSVSAGTQLWIEGGVNFSLNSGNVSATTLNVQHSTTVLNVTGGTMSSSGLTNFSNDSTTTISGGSVSAGGEMWVGESGSGTTVDVTGGTVSSASWLAVGRNGTDAELNISGGVTQAVTNAANTTHFVTIASFGGSSGTITVSDNGTLEVLNGEGIIVGEAGTGALEVIGSSATIDIQSGDLRIGLNADSLDSSGVGTVSFFADAMGVSAITVANDVNLSSPDGDFLAVDFSAWLDDMGLTDVLLIDGITSQGEFVGLAQDAIVPGSNGRTIDYSVSGDIWLRAIPEPSVALLGGLGLLGLLRRRRP